MPSGRPDYWYGMLPGYSGPGVSQKEWQFIDTLLLIHGTTGSMIEDPVPENYILYIMSGVVTSSLPGIQNFGIYINDVSVALNYYDFSFHMPLNSSATYKLKAGEEFELRFSNLMGVPCNYSCMFFGFLEYKIE